MLAMVDFVNKIKNQQLIYDNNYLIHNDPGWSLCPMWQPELRQFDLSMYYF